MVTQTCTQKGCAGTIEDGYCGLCGYAPEKRTDAISSPAYYHRNGSASQSGVTGSGYVSAGRGARGSRRSRRSSSRTSRRQLGAGLISLPELPSTDPEKTVLADAKIPEHKRYCSNCDAPLKRDVGYCGKCGQKFSFIASLKAGDLVASQYEVRGALAFGGLGWIYLAFDRVLSRYVVLKGLLNVHDESSVTAAVAERQFLASVKHPNIVGIYNFVQHGNEGFIVMEYVGGKTLKQIRQERGPLPPGEAVAYIHRVLAAFSYLHDAGLVYCDFKPDNMMLECDDVKLIDLGGVRRFDDARGDIYCTAGYSAPEAAEGPTQSSDLYTIGRALAVLVADFRGLTTDFRYMLPPPADVPVFAEQESLYRFLLKATARNPEDRFESADDMAEQLLGVLREIVAVSMGEPRPASSNFFGTDALAYESGEDTKPVAADARYVPAPLMDTNDEAAQCVAAALAIPNSKKRLSALEHADKQFPQSSEAKLRLVIAHTEARLWDKAEKFLDAVASADPWDWRPLWLRGRLELAKGNAAQALTHFDQVYFDMPGELVPKLGVALAAEQAGDLALAQRMYGLVLHVDDSFVSAAFGAARCAMDANDRPAALDALRRVPRSSSVYVRARVQEICALITSGPAAPSDSDLVVAGTIAEQLPLDTLYQGEIRSRILRTALDLLRRKQLKPNKKVSMFGCRMQESDLRLALERTFRVMAQHVTGDRRIELIDQANQVRPRTLI